MIDAVKSYIEGCPLLTAKKINVNYLGEKPCKYTIETIPASPVVKKYVDGGELRQYLFALTSRESYDADTIENMNVARFFEEFEAWINEQDNSSNFPTLTEAKCTPTKIEVTSTGFLSAADETTARFTVELKLTYRKER